MYGYNRTEFKTDIAIDNRPNSGGKELKERNEDNTRDLPVYAYQHDEQACYYCVISASDASLDKVTGNTATDRLKRLAYYRALAREKRNLSKVSDYINGSADQTP